MNLRLGNPLEAIRQLSYVSSLATSAGYLSISLGANLRRSTLLRKDGLVQEAQQIVAESATLLIPGYMDDVIFYNWEAALIERSSERHESAARGLDLVVAAAERVDYRTYLALATPISAETWVKLGRSDAAERTLHSLEHVLDGRTRCQQSSVLCNVVTVGIQIMNDSGRQISFAGRSLYANGLLALEYERECPMVNIQGTTLLALAHISHANGHFKEARDWLEKSKALPWSIATVRLEQLEMGAALARAEGNISEASRTYGTMMIEAQKLSTTFSREYLCKSVLGLAEMNQIQGRTDDKVDSEIKKCLQARDSGISVPLFRQFERRSRALMLFP